METCGSRRFTLRLVVGSLSHKDPADLILILGDGLGHGERLLDVKVHKRAAEGGDTTPDGLKQLWYELNRKYYGEAITIDEPLKMEWARIPHFYTPFYVYQYATGYSAATALASAILEQGEPATRRYLNFLTKGGSDYPIELLKGAGVDMSTPQPVQAVVRQFEETLDEMEELAK